LFYTGQIRTIQRIPTGRFTDMLKSHNNFVMKCYFRIKMGAEAPQVYQRLRGTQKNSSLTPHTNVYQVAELPFVIGHMSMETDTAQMKGLW
jgi:hypothetical protein